ncbi:MAG TPA: hypothetical protein VF311_04070 [Terriglobales bacterium]|jgi:hypothetical protein
MAQQTTGPAPKGFKIPVEFLRTFQTDMRFVPQVPHPNGWMIFDWDMLTTVLRNGDPAVREKYAAALHTLKEQWNLVMVAKEEETAAR